MLLPRHLQRLAVQRSGRIVERAGAQLVRGISTALLAAVMAACATAAQPPATARRTVAAQPDAPPSAAPSSGARAAKNSAASAGAAQGTATPASPSASSADSARRLPPATFADLAESVSPSIVGVAVMAFYPFHFTREDLGEETYLARLDEWAQRHPNFEIGEDGFYTPRSGSGVVIRPDGLILTSWHIVDGMAGKDRLRVRTQDGRLFEGDDVKVVGHDNMTDLCVLQVAASDLLALPWGDSVAARQGDWVMVVGNPLDFAFSVSQGIISGQHRQVGSEVEIEDLIQTTAMINPGSSGGGMVGLDGRLIGIVMAMATRGDSWQGLGFAIPEQIARPVADSLIADGFVRRGYLGIQMERITRFGAKRRGLPERDGVLITGLIPEYPAAKSRLRINDIIVGINGETIRDESDVFRLVATRRAGDLVKLTVAGPGDEARDVEIKLAERPAPDEIAFHLEQAERRREQVLGPLESAEEPDGADLGAASKDDLDYLLQLGLRVAPWLGDGRGVVLLRVSPGSIAERAGLRVGDIVLRVDGESVGQVSQLRQRLTEAGKSAQLEADRGGELQRITLELP